MQTPVQSDQRRLSHTRTPTVRIAGHSKFKSDTMVTDMMARIGDIGERQLIEDFRSFIRPEGMIGPGDDAAVIENGTVVTTDVVTFDRHFPAGMSYEQFGWYAAAVNFSDLAAMGARPIGFLAALALPLDLEAQAAYDIMSGIDQCCEFCGTGIVGGDTKTGPGIVAGTALGTMDGRPPMRRSGARPGDMVTVDADAGTVDIEGVEMRDTVSSAVMVDGKVLLLKRPDSCHSFPGMWSLVAGKIEPGETPEQAARREIAEETGLEVGAPDASTRPVHVREGSILWRVHPFLFRLDSAEPVLNDENEAFEWVSPEDIQSRETVVDTFLVVDRMLNNQ